MMKLCSHVWKFRNSYNLINTFRINSVNLQDSVVCVTRWHKAGEFNVRNEISSIICIFVIHTPGCSRKLGGKLYICIDVQASSAAWHQRTIYIECGRMLSKFWTRRDSVALSSLTLWKKQQISETALNSYSVFLFTLIDLFLLRLC